MRTLRCDRCGTYGNGYQYQTMRVDEAGTITIVGQLDLLGRPLAHGPFDICNACEDGLRVWLLQDWLKDEKR
jgi:hypothetical protein